ncbi:ABC transporter substrate-binding protein [Pseudoroseomonas cervicalis]|uniref:ABC transporter substrate-binding protein n=1 Tax=Teichococcus cervicalis TaxID=204525 RepID=UPI0027802B16|nr:ABC transporter substrate-binding protein [Pseudoroseomonas cervicalis]MDQ1079759.1 peptide/nickel transport system substrate-binding protein [Pseudoroseomonas cervicalis]
MQRRGVLAGAAGLGLGLGAGLGLGGARGAAAQEAGAAGRPGAPALAKGSAATTLRFIPQSDPAWLDPLFTTAYAVRNHGHLCWDQLYGLDIGFRPQPQLAEGHVVEEDGKRWVFTLREGPTFHDGEKIRAIDAVASIQRWMARDTHGQTLAARLAEIRALDDRRFEIRLQRPFSAMLQALAKASSYPCFVYPERFARQPASQPLTEVVGSGPYRYEAAERAPGKLAVYRRFERYIPARGAVSLTAGPKFAGFERLEWRHLPDPAAAAEALQNGEVDWWEQVAPDLRPLLRHTRHVVVDRLDYGGTIAMLRPNHLHPPFDDPAARRALLPALRQADFMTAIMGDSRDLWRDDVGCFPPGSPLASSVGMEALTGPRDVEAAQRALRESGHAGARVVVLHPTDVVNNSNLTAVATDLLQRIGFTTESAACDWRSFLQRRASRAAPSEGGWNALVGLFSGLDMMTPGGHPLLRANGARAWFGWPELPRLEALREQWFDTAGEAEQKLLGEAIQRRFFEDLPYWPLGQYLIDSAWRSNVVGHRKGMALPLNVRRV